MKDVDTNIICECHYMTKQCEHQEYEPKYHCNVCKIRADYCSHMVEKKR